MFPFAFLVRYDASDSARRTRVSVDEDKVKSNTVLNCVSRFRIEYFLQQLGLH